MSWVARPTGNGSRSIPAAAAMPLLPAEAPAGLHYARLADAQLRGDGLVGGVLSGGGGVGAAGGCSPSQHAWFWHLEPPALGLFDAVVMSAER